MSLTARIREQLIASFRAELAEHVQTMTDGLLAVEQDRVQGGERQEILDGVFRAAHSLKGAARAVGVTVIEQLAHALESVLDALQQDTIESTPDLFTACYHALDAIQAVQETYEAGETTPPMQVIEALADMQPFQPAAREGRETRVAAKEGKLAVKGDEVTVPSIPPAPREPESVQPVMAALPSPSSEEAELRAVQAGGEKGSQDMISQKTQGMAQGVASADAPATASGNVAGGLGSNGTIRVTVEKLDALMNQLNELVAAKIRAEQQLAQIRRVQNLASEWQKEWLLVRNVHNRLVRQEKSGMLSVHRLKSIDALRRDVFGVINHDVQDRGFSAQASPIAAGGPGDNGSNGGVLRELGRDISQLLGYFSASQAQLHELNALSGELSRQCASDTMHMGMVIDDLEQEIKRVRMLPLTTITGPFGRMVRDLGRQAGKEAALVIAGGDTELDKQVLEQIKDPLIHLLRNAVDHGVESPEGRERRGKPRVGRITLLAEQLGQNIVIRVSDDGEGLDYDAIRDSIARRGVLDADSLTEADLREAIFQAGVSSSPIITDISGRGVGLDVVRRNVEALRGTVDVRSMPGQGATFTLTLPLRLASSRGLLVRAGGETFAIPLNNIVKIESYMPHEITSMEGHDTIRYNGAPLTLVPLSDVLELPSLVSPPRGETGGGDGILVVIVAAAERRMAFAVDELAGQREMVIKPLGKQLSRIGGIAGATVLGNRRVVLVLNAGDLIKLAMRGRRRSVLDTLAHTVPPGAEHVKRKILVVDDSITTRTLEKNILEAAGYVVRLATDGQEALSDISSAGTPDLIVTDVAMPRMDGFELTERIKQDGNMGHLPVILVTSLDSDEDKARGIEAGADAYIVKSGFDQDNLLETIEQLI
jgi:two-component system chemotaxis sensor kinase CheA